MNDDIQLVLYPERLQDPKVIADQLLKIQWYIYEILQDIRRKPNDYLPENSRNISIEILNQKIALLKQEITCQKHTLKNNARFYDCYKNRRIALKKEINENIRKLKDLKLDLQYLRKK